MKHTYYDFFAGGGMAGLGLGSNWRCTFANDIDPQKAISYRKNHHEGKELLLRNIMEVTLEDLPATPDLIWASFPCQDLSLAGKGAGLAGERSGMFKPFWKLVEQLHKSGRGPKIIALENVSGAITSNGGRDFATLASALSSLGYQFGAVVLDAVHFLPQSRPRLFMIGIRDDLNIPKETVAAGPCHLWHPPSLIEGYNLLPKTSISRWNWWNLDTPKANKTSLSTIIEENPEGIEWHTATETLYLLNMMSDVNIKKIKAAQELRVKTIGTLYRRTRKDKNGVKCQRAEVRFDGIAGCLRTPSGGSSRQTIVVVEEEKVRTRLLSSREAASLMGMPETYILPTKYNEAYKLVGDGVAVPVVSHLEQGIFNPVIQLNRLALVA